MKRQSIPLLVVGWLSLQILGIGCEPEVECDGQTPCPDGEVCDLTTNTCAADELADDSDDESGGDGVGVGDDDDTEEPDAGDETLEPDAGDEETPEPDAGEEDAGEIVVDAGEEDAGEIVVDAGEEDAGEIVVDAGEEDAGEIVVDAGEEDAGEIVVDAGEEDAGEIVVDAGEEDAGEIVVDAGEEDAGEIVVDAGEEDAGEIVIDAGEEDAGEIVVDAGEEDAGEIVVDAGEEDAGEPDAGEIITFNSCEPPDDFDLAAYRRLHFGFDANLNDGVTPDHSAQPLVETSSNYVRGRADRALVLSEGDAYNLGDDFAFNECFTFAAWVRVGNNVGTTTIADFGDGQLRIEADTDEDLIRIHVGDDSQTINTDGFDTVWHHLVVAYYGNENSGVEVHWDGDAREMEFESVMPVFGAVEIGSGNDVTDEWHVDELMIFDRLLSGAEVDALVAPRSPNADYYSDDSRPPFAVQVAAGDQRACARLADNTVQCWGDVELPMGLPLRHVDVDIYGERICAVNETGSPVCFVPQDDSYWTEDTPYGVVLEEISVGRDHVCGVDVYERLVCWGENDKGQLDAPLGRFVDVVSAEKASCALRDDGEVHCWGAVSDATLPFGPEVTFVELAIGGESDAPPEVCAIDDDGQLHCAFLDADFSSDVEVSEIGFVEVSMRGSTRCTLDGEGVVVCDTSGDSTTLSRWTPRTIYVGDGVVCGADDVGAISCSPTEFEDRGPGQQQEIADLSGTIFDPPVAALLDDGATCTSSLLCASEACSDGECQSTDSWTSINTFNAPAERVSHDAVWMGTQMVVYGGSDGIRYFNDGGVYDPLTDRWQKLYGPDWLQGRYGHCMAWTGQHMLVFGGNTGSENLADNGAIYSPVDNSWKQMSTANAPSARGDLHRRCAWTGEQLIIWGGQGDDVDNLTYLYNPTLDEWTVGAASPIEARQGHLGEWMSNLQAFVVWGGLPSDANSESDGANTGAVYFPSLDFWFQFFSETTPTGRKDLTGGSVSLDSGLFMFGGEVDNVADALYGGVLENRPASFLSWELTLIGEAPYPRKWQSTVWTGRDVLLWGGTETVQSVDAQEGAVGGVATGHHYDPRFQIWRTMTTDGAPSGMSQHTAVWTGSQMLVWGAGFGVGQGDQLDNDGGAYTPLSSYDAPLRRKWTHRETVVGSSPSGRGNANMVQDGAGVGMLLVGGETNDETKNTWRYDGVQWDEAFLDEDPSRFVAQAAVTYDPDRGNVVLHGGISEDGELFNDTWEWDGFNWYSSDGGDEFPIARRQHGMAFDPTCNCLMLFGGETETGADNEVWYYDGEWSEATANSPERPGPRSQHVVVTDYRGNGVLVAGGVNSGGSYLKDIWRYRWIDEVEGDDGGWQQLPIYLPEDMEGQLFGYYDHALARVVLVNQSNGSAYAVDDFGLTRLDVDDGVSSNRPGADGSAAAHDPVTNAAIVFGGWWGQDTYSTNTYQLVDEALVAHYRFDDIDDDTAYNAIASEPVLLNNSGYSVTEDDSYCVSGSCALYEGLGYFSAIEGETVDLGPQGAFSITAWVKDFDGEQVIIAQLPDVAKLYIDGETTQLKLEICGNGDCHDEVYDFTSSSIANYSDEWTFIAATFDGRFSRVFVNGELQGGNGAFDVYEEANGLLVGGDLESFQESSVGLMDEFKLYRRRLLDLEIRREYEKLDPPPPPD